MNILSLQSWVAYGHVGNAAALLPLQRLGAEVWAVHTVQFSNHPGHGDWEGRAATGEEIAALIRGVERRGVFPRCDAVLSGYMGDGAVAHAILDAVARVRAANPDALYCCDPVIGDAGRVYVREPIPHLIAARAVPEADLLTPNQFELERLTGIACATRAEARRAIGALQAAMRPAGPRAVLLTSLEAEETAPGALDVLAADASGVAGVAVPKLGVAASGAGDLTAALFLFHYGRSRDVAAAMRLAVAATHAVLRQTVADGARDLRLVAAQEAVVAPDLAMAQPLP